jgi:hypothetical protein
MAEQLLLEEAALMQVLLLSSCLEFLQCHLCFVAEAEPLRNFARVWVRAREWKAVADGHGAVRWRITV